MFYLITLFSSFFTACGPKTSTVSPAPVDATQEETKTVSILAGQWSDLEDVTGSVIATHTNEDNKTGTYIGSPSVFALASNIDISELAFDSEKAGQYGEQIRLTINEDLTGNLYSAAFFSYNKDFEGTNASVFENINQNGKVVAKENEDGSFALDIEMLLIHYTVCKDQNIDDRVERSYSLTAVCTVDGNNAVCTHNDNQTTLKR